MTMDEPLPDRPALLKAIIREADRFLAAAEPAAARIGATLAKWHELYERPEIDPADRETIVRLRIEMEVCIAGLGPSLDLTARHFTRNEHHDIQFIIVKQSSRIHARKVFRESGQGEKDAFAHAPPSGPTASIS
jgi:hypothetical protein